MKKVYFSAVLLVFLNGCKKSEPQPFSDNSNTEITITSTGTFNVRVEQSLYATHQIYTQFSFKPISNYDKRLHTSGGDGVTVTIIDATAPCHLVFTHNGLTLDDQTITDVGATYSASF